MALSVIRNSIVPALLAALVVSPALAQSGFTSAYTDLDLDQCLILEADDFGASWACPGYKGYPLLVQEGDLRFSLSYGFDADENGVGFQTLPPFNYLGAKLEWRLSNALGRWFPIATIVRYHTAHPETGEDHGQVLVVSQIAEGNSCHIAYVDARANANANELARQAADKAGDFDCMTDEIEIIGAFGGY
ncbi:hypothetical protein GGR20_003142 [Devosia subaequoris]|uniref:Uncharacterized protein n=1 Tax=Devosia subaequoris TaxID=395930 RepID=A0A7W6IQL7_9HYPH|nr:hypothetical protein [Devosia subaequoris]MBB4053482.1 hypothetical protein [Devosia subaequoris]MCP1210858.1 hypothetical protein [Devosia subaequoris]